MLFVSFIIVNLFPSLVKVKSRLEAVFFIILPQILLHVYPWAQGEGGGGGVLRILSDGDDRINYPRTSVGLPT